jgi:hypothetical protein
MNVLIPLLRIHLQLSVSRRLCPESKKPIEKKKGTIIKTKRKLYQHRVINEFSET